MTTPLHIQDRNTLMERYVKGSGTWPLLVLRNGKLYTVTKAVPQGTFCRFWICTVEPQADDLHDTGDTITLRAEDHSWQI